MTDKNEGTKSFCTCLENPHFAEMMQKAMGQQGIGALCAEMMRKVHQEDGKSCMSLCTDMMQALMKGSSDTKKEPAETGKEARHAGDR